MVLGLAIAGCTAGAEDDQVAASDAVDGATTSTSATTRADVSPTPPASLAPGTCTPGAQLPGGGVANGPATSDPFPWDRAEANVRDGFEVTEVISGGPPPDGIVPIEEPCFDDVERADSWLAADSPVMVVEVDGDARAYPLSILTQHEIANDVVGGIPIVVTYCPLCNSGLAFARTIDGVVSDFGTSGRLYQSNLVMYDRQTRTLWTQFTGEAVWGDLVDATLERVPTGLVGWSDFRDAEPDGLVLSPDTFPSRDYGRNPYPGYEGNGDQFLFRGPRDDRLPPNDRVVGLGGDDQAIAIPLTSLQEQRTVAVEVDGAPVVVWWAPGQASALDAGTVDDGLDVGSTAAFSPVRDDGTVLTFTVDPGDDDQWIDDQTGTTWNLLGTAVAGDLEGTSLEPVARDDTFWFVWFAFRPHTTIAS